MGDSFFTMDEVKTTQPMQRAAGCGACGLHLHCTSPRMEASGQGERGILIIGECPTAQEDARGETLTGPAGQLLRRKLRWQGIDLERDCRKINAVCCYTSKMPSTQQIEACRPRIWKEINSFKPHLILLLGEAAIKSFLGGRWKDSLGTQTKEGSYTSGIVTKWHGWTIPDRDTGAWVVPMFHPSYVLHTQENNGNPIIAKLFDLDLQKARKLLDEPVYKPAFKETAGVEIVTDLAKLCTIFEGILEWETLIAFDYETTGLKPHAAGHRIATCSISVNGDRAWSFDFPPKGTKAHRLFKQILTSPKIGKIASNLKMEDNWTNELLGIPVVNWVWDTMLAAHVLDNRKGVTGLKFQAYVQFGVIDYASHLDNYLHSKKEDGANAFNKIDDAPHHDLLLYGGMDSMLEFRLAKKQMEELGYDRPNKN